MTVLEFINSGLEADVYDDVCEVCQIAFAGNRLTEDGERRFSTVLGLEVELYDGQYCNNCVVKCDTEEEACAVAELFNTMAGFCSVEDYDKYVKEE